MKKINFSNICCAFILLVFSLNSLAQSSTSRSWLWAKHPDGAVAPYTNPAISTDQNGNTYVTGGFTGTLTFSTTPSPTTLISAGESDIFIAKYDPSGNVLWAKRAGSTHSDVAWSIKYDGFGNLYIAGSFTESTNFEGTIITNPVANSSNVLLAKYNATTGDFLWVRHGAGEDGYSRQAFSVAVDKNGDPYITGEICNTTTFAPLPTLALSNRWWDIFVVKYNSAGIAQWQTVAGSLDAGYNGEGGNGIAVDQSGKVFVTGYFNGSSTYPTQFGNINLVSNGGGGFYEYDYFLAKYDPSTSTWLWAVNGGGAANDYSKSVSLDSDGNPYVSGVFTGTATFGSTSLSSTGGNDYFIAKYSTDGNLTWIHPTEGTGYFDGNRSKVDANGNLYFAGTFSGTITVGDKTITATGYDNNYIASWNKDGVFQWVKHIPGSYYGHTSAIDVENNGAIDFAEVFAQSETFDCTVLNAGSFWDFAIAKLGTTSGGPDAPTITASANPICNGSSTTLSISSGNLNNATEWKWYTESCGGTLVGSGNSITVSPVQNTTYHVRGEGGCAGPGTCANITIAINNTPPVINSITAPVDPLPVNTSMNLNVTYTGNNVTTALIKWGDASADQTVANPATNFTVPHTYNTPGVYTVIVTLTNGCGISTSSQYQYVVVYDSNGGFVTGGGWINSPAGAYRPDITLTGKGIFGFESKYQKGTTVPSGNTEFKFQAADITFKSTNYEWLVVSGSRAQYKGTGTINGSGNYGFLLTAVDGDLGNSTAPDLFRIKIWDKNNANVIVYDNQYGAADDASLNTQIAGGSIVIHTTKNTSSYTVAQNVNEERSYAGKLTVKALPNPSATQFTLKINSDDRNEMISIRVVDMLGKELEVRTNIFAGQTLEIGNGYRPGIYLVEVIQGKQIKTLKLIKEPN
jgi:hypothetical protein